LPLKTGKQIKQQLPAGTQDQFTPDLDESINGIGYGFRFMDHFPLPPAPEKREDFVFGVICVAI